MKDVQKMRKWLRSVGADPNKLDEKGYYDGYLDLSSVTSLPDGFNPTVGGYLYLSSVTSLPDGFNPTVGGSLYLRSVTSLPDGFNPTVGGYLDLSSVTSLPDGFNPTVGGSLYLSSVTKHINKEVSIPYVFHWEWRGRRFIKADGIFQEVVSQRGNVYRVKNIGSKDVTYLVTDGNDRWSHGKTLKEAKEDLIYKISNRDTSRYESLTLDDVLTRAEAIECYRVITGACAQGTKAFVTSLPKVKDKYTVREIITLTEGQYGGQTFKDYFNK